MVGHFAVEGIRRTVSLPRAIAWNGAGAVVIFLLSSLAAWGYKTGGYLHVAWPMLSLVFLGNLLAIFAYYKMGGVPKSGNFWLIFVCITVAFLGVISTLALARLYYSRSFLGTAYVLALVWMGLGCRLSSKVRIPKVALVPGGMADELISLSGISWEVLKGCSLDSQIDGVAVDLHQRLSSDWVRFISNCSLKRIPVYHAAVVFESATGRVSLAHLSEGLMEGFQLSPGYVLLKRIADIFMVLVTTPITIPLLLVTAILVKCSSPGPVFFRQDRIGQGGRPFCMVKFRTMRVETGHKARFATDEGSRVTAVGGWLRRSRLDELPQVWNILKGEMALIGPRPEQVPFASQFEKEIPFYSYRHLVKPGLTGWAQVTQGYAAGKDQNQAKLELDLYYIKYFSAWLDLWILGKTLRTVLTGFGAR